MTSEKADNKKEDSKEADCAYRFVLDESKCIGCRVCVETCPNDVLETKDGFPVAVQPEACEGCEVCTALCEQEAIDIEES